MYPKFIELHDASTGGEQFVNVSNIEGVFTEMVSEGIFVTHIDLTDGGCYQVRESYDDLKKLIKDCGCLIHKADPRLDMSSPLTLDDLRDMVGEPVWNSNIDVWMLVKDVTDTWVKMLWTSGNVSEYTEDELIAYPVYRMRRA